MQVDQIKSIVVACLVLGTLAATHRIVVKQGDGVVGSSIPVAPLTAPPVCLLNPDQLPRHPGSHKPLFCKVIAMAGSFETDRSIPDAFSAVSGNFDGQGISVGVLQENIGRGSLQPLLAAMERDYPTVMMAVFGPEHHAQIRAMLASDPDAQMRWAVGINKHGWRLWRSEFEALGRTPEYQRLQLKAACRIYSKALAFEKKFGLHSERGVALMFDILTQNGGMKGHLGDATPVILRDLAELQRSGRDSEQNRLEVVAKQRSAVAKPLWQKDVLSRKLGIAHGVGTVHGRRYNLELDFGISLQPLP